jgi:Zn/Cd-binding protein ZinT
VRPEHNRKLLGYRSIVAYNKYNNVHFLFEAKIKERVDASSFEQVSDEPIIERLSNHYHGIEPLFEAPL